MNDRQKETKGFLFVKLGINLLMITSIIGVAVVGCTDNASMITQSTQQQSNKTTLIELNGKIISAPLVGTKSGHNNGNYDFTTNSIPYIKFMVIKRSALASDVWCGIQGGNGYYPDIGSSGTIDMGNTSVADRDVGLGVEDYFSLSSVGKFRIEVYAPGCDWELVVTTP